MEKIKEVINLKNIIFLIFYQSSTESGINKIDVKSQLEHQIQNQELKKSGWSFD